MTEHLQAASVRRLLEEAEALMGAAMAIQEFDLVVRYATACQALRSVLTYLEGKARDL